MRKQNKLVLRAFVRLSSAVLGTERKWLITSYEEIVTGGRKMFWLVAESSGKISRRQITLPDVRLYRCSTSLRIRVLSRRGLHASAQASTSRRNTVADVRELLNSSYLLLKSRTQCERRGAGRNSIETGTSAERDETEVPENGVGFRVFSLS